MNTHGDPNQAAPTIDANSVIHLTWNDATPGGIYGTNKGGQGNAGPGQYCRTYIDQAETDLQGSQHLQQPSQGQLVQFSQCMRANGIPDFPDPSNGGMSFNRAGDLNPSNPVFQKASTLCAKKTGLPGFATGGAPPPGAVVFNGDAHGRGRWLSSQPDGWRRSPRLPPPWLGGRWRPGSPWWPVPAVRPRRPPRRPPAGWRRPRWYGRL